MPEDHVGMEAGMTQLHEHRTDPMVPAAAIGSLTRDMLTWLAQRPRTYAETMEAWRSSCPRLTIWEDALADDLVRVEDRGKDRPEPRVVLTARGRATLDGG
jgi:hypothetical protein